PSGPVQPSGAVNGRMRAGVISILTDPSGPVQPVLSEYCHTAGAISILTDPSGPVQLSLTVSGVAVELIFQSSPTLPGRCNTGLAPVISTWCNFNPHRPFRAGATPCHA